MNDKMQVQQEIPYRIDGRYRLEEHVGSGSFGIISGLVHWVICWPKFTATVYKAFNIINRCNYAIKLELITNGVSSSLEQESQILKQLYDNPDSALGIPCVHWFGHELNFNVLVLDLLGPSLQHLVVLWGKFNAITMGHIGDQLVSVLICMDFMQPTRTPPVFQLLQLQYIHFHGYVHSDIQPRNILVSANRSPTIYLIDFGLSKRYCHDITGKHVPFCLKHGLTGTPAFASINSHLGGEMGCRDDIESLVYVLVYLLSGSLPWLQITCHKTSKISAVLTFKQTMVVEQLCDKQGFLELSKLLLYTHMLSFSDTPNYDYMCCLLQTTVSPLPGSTQLSLVIKQDLCCVHPDPNILDEIVIGHHPTFTPRMRPQACVAHNYVNALLIQKTPTRVQPVRLHTVVVSVVLFYVTMTLMSFRCRFFSLSGSLSYPHQPLPMFCMYYSRIHELLWQ